MTATLRHVDLVGALRGLGIGEGETVMVHASLRALGPVEGGPAGVARALVDAIGAEGTLMAYVSWDRSPYEATLGGRAPPRAERAAWPAFDPATAQPNPGFGALNRFIRRLPGVRRSPHPDASMAAVGRRAGALVDVHPLGTGYGPGSPLERFVFAGGKFLILGAPLDAITALDSAEALAEIPGKRRVVYEVPLRDEDGGTRWEHVEECDSHGILDCFAGDEGPDAIEAIAADYVALGRNREARIGGATCRLFDAVDLVAYGVAWLEERFGAETAAAPAAPGACNGSPRSLRTPREPASARDRRARPRSCRGASAK